MSKLNDLTGQKLGRLTIIERADNHITSGGQQKTVWRCMCECGTVIDIQAGNLRKRHCMSCGCDIPPANLKHGDCRNGKVSRLYSIWSQMIRRCHDVRAPRYDYYGGRGITVCNEWRSSYEEFRKWATNNGYEDSLSIDRIDVNGNYCPENCRWATSKTQSNNSRHNVYVEFNGETKTLSEWAEFADIPYKTLHSRVRRFGWTIERALSTPVRNRGK